MKKLVLFFLLSVLSFSLKSQSSFVKKISAAINAGLITKTSDGNNMLVDNTLDTNLTGVSYQIVFVKFDDAGDTLWTKRLNFPPGFLHTLWLSDFLQVSDSGFIVMATCGNGTTEPRRFGILRFDKNCNCMWNKFFRKTGHNIYAHFISEGVNEKILIAGKIFPGIVNLDAGFFMSLDKYGNLLSLNMYGMDSALINEIHSVVDDSTGYLLGANFVYNGGDITLIRVDAAGVMLGTKTFRTLYPFYEGGYVIKKAPHGYVMTGSMGLGIGIPGNFIFRIDSVLNFMSWKGFSFPSVNNTAGFFAGELSPDKGFVFLSSLIPPITGPETTVFKTDSLDNFQWAKVYQRGSLMFSGSPMYARLDDGSIIYSNYDYDTLQTPEKGLMLMKIDPTGDGCITQSYTAVVTNVSPYDTIVNVLTDTLSFIDTVFTIPQDYRYGLTLTALCTATGIEAAAAPEELRIYPNPFTEKIQFNFDPEAVEIRDVTGKVLKTFYHPSRVLHIENISSGIYFIKTVSQNKVRVFKAFKM